MKRPSFQFYPADWRKDPALSTCSLAARGLWIEVMCIAHEAENYGVLSINGKAMTINQIARLVGESPSVVARLMAELEATGVYSKDDSDCIYSRRMVKDEAVRRVRASAGRLGGNPKLIERKDNHTEGETAYEGLDLVKQNHNQDHNQEVNQDTNPIQTPSSSSSVNPLSSSLRSEDSPPAKKKSTFKAWLSSTKAKGEKPISTYQPIFDLADKLKIDHGWLEIAWLKFVDRYTRDENATRKRYIDWRRVFYNAIADNWFRLWYFGPDGTPMLTTAGIHADLATRDAA